VRITQAINPGREDRDADVVIMRGWQEFAKEQKPAEEAGSQEWQKFAKKAGALKNAPNGAKSMLQMERKVKISPRDAC